MAKDIKELTEKEAKEILAFVYPKKDENDRYFLSIKHEPIINEDGSQQITFSGRSIIGIEYHNGQDRCMLHFDNTKAVLWLYKNGYEIDKLLEVNSYMSEMEKDFENFSFAIQWLGKRREIVMEDKKHVFTLDYVFKELKEYNDKYYFKDYE